MDQPPLFIYFLFTAGGILLIGIVLMTAMIQVGRKRTRAGNGFSTSAHYPHRTQSEDGSQFDPPPAIFEEQVQHHQQQSEHHRYEHHNAVPDMSSHHPHHNAVPDTSSHHHGGFDGGHHSGGFDGGGFHGH